MFFKERVAAFERYQLITASERKKMCSLEKCALNKYFEVRNRLQQNFMCFWLNYCDENHIERILVAVKDIDHLFNLASEVIKADNLHLFLLSDDTRIDDNEYLESPENGTELIVCTKEQIQKLLIYFEIKRYLSLKNISYPLNMDYFL